MQQEAERKQKGSKGSKASLLLLLPIKKSASHCLLLRFHITAVQSGVLSLTLLCKLYHTVIILYVHSDFIRVNVSGVGCKNIVKYMGE